MIKYYKELEDLNNQYLYLIKENQFKNYIIDIKTLPLEFYLKYKNLFKRLHEMDLLCIKKIDKGHKKTFWKSDKNEQFDYDWFYSCYINGLDISNYNITPEGKNRLDYLVSIFKENYKGETEYYYEELDRYIYYILKLFIIDNQNIISKKYDISSYLHATLKIGEYQNKLNDDDKRNIKQAIDEINNYKVKIPLKPYEAINMYLPNAWYITPYKHLYNSMGPDGHKESNLIYPYRHAILRDNITPNPKECLQDIRNIERNGYIDRVDYLHFLNLIYEFPCIYPEYYYDLTEIDKSAYRFLHRRSYNPKLVNLIIGIESAQAGLYKFFFDLRTYSNDYEKDLSYLKKYTLDDILVRCCGFHKISSIVDKTITTSCINYENEFIEYLEKGWKIDFVKPIILSKEKGTIEEYPEEFIIIKTFRKMLKQ